MPAQPIFEAVSDQLGENTDLSQKSEITPFFVQKEEYNKQVEQLVYHTTDDFKNQRLQTAQDTNPVLKKYGVTAVHLFKEFNQDSHINNEDPTFDYEGYLGLDMYSPDGKHCGLLAFGRKKGLISNNFNGHTVGQNGIVVFNRYGQYADINYCTDNLIIALKIAQCGERVAFAKDINDSIQLYENITNNTPIFIDTLLKDHRAFNLLDSKHVLNLKSKKDIHAYLMTLKNDFIKEHGVINENPIADDVATGKMPLSDTSGAKPKGKASLQIVSMKDIQAQPIRWLWHGWLPLGKLTILAGAGGCGKTNLLLSLIASISLKGVFPDGTHCSDTGRILIYSTEDDPADTLKPRLIANGADLSKIDFIAGRINEKGEREPFDPTSDLPMIYDYAEKNPDIKLLMIDPIVSAIGGDINKATDVRKSLQVVVDFANQYNCAVVGITHFSKGTSGSNPAERVIGSQAFTALARMVWSVTRREDDGDCILVRAKSNISTLDGGIRYQLEEETIEGGIETTKTAWLGTIEGTAKELLNDAELSGGGNGDSALNMAKEFLVDILSTAGKMLSNDVQIEAKNAGYSVASIRRAKDSLGIKPFKDGSAWYWKLPLGFYDAPQVLPEHKQRYCTP